MMEPDLGKYRLSTGVYQPPKAVPKAISEERLGEWFIKGPIPGAWLVAASKLPGAFTLPVALTIFYVKGLKRGKTIELERYHFDLFEVKKDSARRALERLQNAGLIECKKNGQRFQITVLPIKADMIEMVL